jgi:predicted DsbA family dithiol-disulfide isomerase
MYAMLEREAREAGLPLHWPRHLPNTRQALAAAEWVRRHQPRVFPQFHRSPFDAHFVLGEDLEDPAVIDRHAHWLGIDLAALHAAFADGSAAEAVTKAERIGRQYGVQGTPAWLLDRRLIAGLRPAADFERLAEHASRLPR